MTLGLKDLLASAKAKIGEVTASAAAEEHAAEARPLFLDVREEAELAGGKIPGALHVPRGLLEVKAASDSPAREPLLGDPSRSIIVFCQSGVRSALAAQTLKELGFAEVRSMAGGFAAWAEGGHARE